eukprot:COSAG01_NODE_14_length_41020_cov_40.702133_24_plen_52_part_00
MINSITVKFIAGIILGLLLSHMAVSFNFQSYSKSLIHSTPIRKLAITFGYL